MRNAKSYLLVSLCVLASWVMYGASCPYPRTPVYFEVIPDTDSDVDTPLPACIDGFVCISFKNTASIPVRMALYLHDGCEVPDEARTYLPDCCTVDNSIGSCACECPGEQECECLLTVDQIFDDVFLYPISGSNFVTLQPNGSILTRVRCNQVKTVGVALSGAGETDDPTTNPSDQLGPAYQDAPGGVATFTCDGTIQFSADDINQTDPDNPDLALVVLDVQTSN